MSNSDEPSRLTRAVAEITETRIASALVFSLIFVLIGTFLPIAHFSLAPMGQFVEVDDYHAADMGADETVVTTTYTRKATANYPVDVHLEIIRSDSSVVRRGVAFEFSGVMEKGRHVLTNQLELDQPLRPGTYRIEVITEVHLPHGITRHVTFTSNEFQVYPVNETGTPTETETPADDASRGIAAADNTPVGDDTPQSGQSITPENPNTPINTDHTPTNTSEDTSNAPVAPTATPA